MQTRENALHEWLKTIYPNNDFTLTPLAGDASFRRYYRLQQDMLSQIVMDAPPAKVALAPFVAIRELLSQQGILTPQIHAVNYDAGFALLEDFGNILFGDAVKQKSTAQLYEQAMAILCQIHQNPAPTHLAKFDQAFMLQELTLFRDWFLERYLGLTISDDEQNLLARTFQQLTTHLAQQPQVLIHRDYHSRNIMLLEHEEMAQSPKFGIIDFQDAMLGPFTYDLVSLLKDCYIQLSSEDLLRWLQYFFELSPLSAGYSFTEFQRAFDWCGLQRHLRILGTFCRLHFRDGKSNYLADLSLTFQYVMSCVETYAELQEFAAWMKERVQAPFQEQYK